MTELSPAAFTATTAVALTPEERWVWFTALGYLDPALAWEDVPAALAGSGVAASTVEEFLSVLAADHDPVATLAELRAAGPHALEAAYRTAEGGEPAGGAAEVDESAWLAFLHEHGARWDRREETWVAFRDWFRYEADQHGLHGPALAFVEYAESRDKAATFDEYQVPHPGTAEEAAPEAAAYPEIREGDQGEWVAYADALLTRAGY